MSVGWLAGSLRPTEGPPDPFPLARLCAEHLPGGQTLGRALTWYGKSIRHDSGLWVIGYEGVGTARGSLSVLVRQEGTEAAPELVLALLRLGVRPSRVDLAGDVHASVARPRDYFDRRWLADTRTDRAGWVYREDGNGRQSVTLGARASERHCRIYDKPRESEWTPAPASAYGGGGRVRHELELKAALAAAIGHRLLAGEDAAGIWSEQYRRLVRWA